MDTKYSIAVEEAFERGFETVYSENFNGHLGPKGGYDEQLKVLCHPTLGVFLLLESCYGNRLNNAQLYVNWQAKDWMGSWRPNGSGHIWSAQPMSSVDTTDWVWVGSLAMLDRGLKPFLREATKHGTFLRKWVESPMLHFENHIEGPTWRTIQSKRIGEFSDITWSKINLFPKWANEIIVNGMLRKRLTQSV